MSTTIWWIRRDLRLHDNQASMAAMQAGERVVPVFIIDPRLTESTLRSEKRLNFLWGGLHSLDESLHMHGSRLIIRRGDPAEELKKLVTEAKATAIFAEEDYSPYARKRDRGIAKRLPLHLEPGLTALPVGSVRKANGTPYRKFTPFSKAWKSLPIPVPEEIIPAPGKIRTPAKLASLPIPKHAAITRFPAGEAEAQSRLTAFTNGVDAPIYQYAETRDRPDLSGTSTLSPYLRFGMISARQAVATAKRAIQEAPGKAAEQGAQAWLNELIWREFFIAILADFPNAMVESFRPEYRNIHWHNDESDFEAWKSGQTGYPIVDAAMRQLAHTGWMHNRARMIVASFLVKDLLIDWRWGQNWFMQNLIDGDPAANNGGWQWSAGTGTDAAPYFRIFNPILQGKKFDPQGEYVRRWVPELAGVPQKHIHTPWEIPEQLQEQIGVRLGIEYPHPIVDHRSARERTLEAYRQAKEL